MLHHDKDARRILAELAESCVSPQDYVDMIWAQRYTQPSPPASTGWPYRASAGLEQPSKLRKVK
jgi:hypothetical protein